MGGTWKQSFTMASSHMFKFCNCGEKLSPRKNKGITANSGRHFPAISSVDFAAITFVWWKLSTCAIFRWCFLGRPPMSPTVFRQLLCPSSGLPGNDSSRTTSVDVASDMGERNKREKEGVGKKRVRAGICPLWLARWRCSCHHQK